MTTIPLIQKYSDNHSDIWWQPFWHMMKTIPLIHNHSDKTLQPILYVCKCMYVSVCGCLFLCVVWQPYIYDDNHSDIWWQPFLWFKTILTSLSVVSKSLSEVYKSLPESLGFCQSLLKLWQPFLWFKTILTTIPTYDDNNSCDSKPFWQVSQ